MAQCLVWSEPGNHPQLTAVPVLTIVTGRCHPQRSASAFGATGVFLKHPFRGCGTIFQTACWTDRPPYQLAAAVGADALKMRFRAVPTKSAFEGANSGVQGCRWEVHVAAFTVRAEIKHLLFPVGIVQGSWASVSQ